MRKTLGRLGCLTLLAASLATMPALAEDTDTSQTGPNAEVRTQMKTLHEKMEQDRESLKADHEKMKTLREEAQANRKAAREKMKAKHEEMKAKREQMREQMKANQPDTTTTTTPAE